MKEILKKQINPSYLVNGFLLCYYNYCGWRELLAIIHVFLIQWKNFYGVCSRIMKNNEPYTNNFLVHCAHYYNLFQLVGDNIPEASKFSNVLVVI